MTPQPTRSPVERARSLVRPEREAMLRRDPSAQRFWSDNQDLLVDAWADWDRGRTATPIQLDSSLLDPALRAGVEAAWKDPTTESAVRQLLHEAAPGVFAFQFFDPERIEDLRNYLEEVWDAGIPLRPPYGIVLNRRGAMLDPRSAGHLGAPSFQTFYRMLLDTYMRPIARLVFPDVMGFDSQTFGFSINYQPSTDTSIRPHSDASAVTLNINLNLPGEDFTGSSVDFLDARTGNPTSLTFEPGTAMIHRGQVPHAAQPITSGERTNVVLWLFGDNGRVPTLRSEPVTVGAHDRWTIPSAEQDKYAPF